MTDATEAPIGGAEGSAHTLTVHFDDGDSEYLSLTCNLTGPDRPCAVIDCPEDHEYLDRDCIEKHGATALDKCWAVEWFDNGGRESMNTEALAPVSFPVHIEFDDGVVVENVPPEPDAKDQEIARLERLQWFTRRLLRAEERESKHRLEVVITKDAEIARLRKALELIDREVEGHPGIAWLGTIARFALGKPIEGVSAATVEHWRRALDGEKPEHHEGDGCAAPASMTTPEGREWADHVAALDGEEEPTDG